jgi:allene oxide cyclase
MFRRSFHVAVVFAIATLVLGATVVGAATGERGHTLIVVERATSDTPLDLGVPGDTIGDTLTFGNAIYDASNTHAVGRDQGTCFRTNPGLSWECTYTTILGVGNITVQGPFYDDLRDSELSITGGTGRYANARGSLTLHARDAAGSAFTFTFHIIG